MTSPLIDNNLLFNHEEPCTGGFVCEVNPGIVCLEPYQVCDTFMHCIDESDEVECGKSKYN